MLHSFLRERTSIVTLLGKERENGGEDLHGYAKY
jgi:hypothetical protein